MFPYITKVRAGAVIPTPTIGMVGLIDKEEHITTQWFKNEGDAIILVGEIAASVAAGADRNGEKKLDDKKEAGVNAVGDSLGGSRYLKVCHGLKLVPPPRIDLAYEIKIQNAVRDLIREGLLKSAHDCSEGGLAVALAECCFDRKKLFGAELDLKAGDTPAVTVLFNESQSRIVISVAPENLEETHPYFAGETNSISTTWQSWRQPNSHPAWQQRVFLASSGRLR